MFDAFHDWRLLAAALLVVFIASRVIKLRNGVIAVGSIPGLRVPFEQLTLPGVVLPAFKWNPGLRLTWDQRLNFYRRWNSETVSIVPFLVGKPAIYTSSPDVMRQLVSGGPNTPWAKPDISARTTNAWGDNVLSSNQPMWRTHRRVMGPAFTQSATYSLVWDSAVRVYRDMTASEGWDARDSVSLPVTQALTFKFALNVLLISGFGIPVSWDADEEKAAAQGITIQRALKTYTDNVTFFLFAPEFMYKLPFRWTRYMAATRQFLGDYMRNQITERRADIRGGAAVNKDVFSLLVAANEEEENVQLKDSEVMGNVFSLLFAGHETTANTMTAVLGLIGLYPQAQEDMYEEIIKVVGHDREPVFEDFGKLPKVLAVLYESVRLFPSGYLMWREALEDTVLRIPNADGSLQDVVIRAGTQAIIDVIGMEYNPKHFPDPYKFDPGRWQGVSSEADAATAWSIGPRQCIGRKFATVEIVCFLVLLVRDWHVEPVLRKGELAEEWRERIMIAEPALSLGTKDMPVLLRKRSRGGAL
ncbi:cytochrome P450 [Auriscalpium vulgare]|uniref:Cytochrome P450 n=1 Tax=Auriscalpium vulgare TaxID=40419 RepID=A0ACB8S6I1_9AGAM|nr:cytochrome P450 [Auriscalpium vulgare]